MPNFGLLAIIPTTAPTPPLDTQVLQTFGANSTKTTPRSLAATRTDTDGLAVMGRTAHAGLDDVASVTPTTALAAYAKRIRLQLQNKSRTEVLRYAFSGAPFVLLELDPRETLTLSGDDCPGDALLVDTEANTAAFAAVDW